MDQEFHTSQNHFKKIIQQQLERIETLKNAPLPTDYNKLDKIKVGIIGGDGIGPTITNVSQNILKSLLEQHKTKQIDLIPIPGLTIENRALAKQAIPNEILDEIKKCDVTLKGPTHTPEKGDGWPNIESANVSMRKKLDLFANVRPVRIPQENIDWTFFRENTEDLYAVGSQGINVTDDLAIDFRVITTQGSKRIIQAGFNHARKTGKTKVTIVTKANIVKTTDGKFLEIAQEIAQDFPEITLDSWYIDIMTAKLLDLKRRSQFEVMILPNLYGDILTDEAAEIQGGVGTAGSANIGNKYAMFEAIHGSAPRMVTEKRAQYADPSSVLRASAMLLEHIGFPLIGTQLNQALDICGNYEKKISITGREDGATSEQFGDYVLSTINDKNLNDRWLEYIKN